MSLVKKLLFFSLLLMLLLGCDTNVQVNVKLVGQGDVDKIEIVELRFYGPQTVIYFKDDTMCVMQGIQNVTITQGIYVYEYEIIDNTHCPGISYEYKITNERIGE